MGILTFQELMEELESNTGNRDDMGASTDVSSRFGRFINLAQSRMARTAHSFEEFEKFSSETITNTASDDDRFLAVPTDFKKARSLTVQDGFASRKLRYLSPKRFDETVPRPQQYARARPSHFTRYRDQFELWRMPDQTYTVNMRWLKWPTKLTTVGQLSEWDQKDDMIITLATSMLYLSIGRSEDANRFWAIYRNMMSDAIAENNAQPDRDLVNWEVNAVPFSRGDPWLDPFIRSDWI
jgi:hypothetical protein